MRTIGILGTTVAVLLVAGCGSGPEKSTDTAGPSQTTPEPSSSNSTELTQRGFLSVPSNGAVFIQWTRTGGTVTGTLSQAYIDAGAPTRVQTQSEPFTGIVNGSSVTLNFGTVHWTGTLSGSTLTLNHSTSDGSISTSVFRSGTVAAYNQAVSNTHLRADEAFGVQQQQEQQAQAQQRQASNERTLDNEASSVANDILSLESAVASLASTVPAGAETLSELRDHLGTASHDLQLTKSANPEMVCGNADITQGDADIVQGDIDILQGNIDIFNGSEDTVAYAIDQLRRDNAQFRRDLATVGNYAPAGAPSSGAVAAAIALAHNAEAKGRATLAANMQTGKQLLAQANGYAAQAQTICSQRG